MIRIKMVVVAVLVFFFVCTTGSAYAYNYGNYGNYGSYGRYGYGTTSRYGNGGRYHYIYEQRGNSTGSLIGGLIGGVLIGGILGYFLGGGNDNDDQSQIVYMYPSNVQAGQVPNTGQVIPQSYTQFSGGYILQRAIYEEDPVPVNEESRPGYTAPRQRRAINHQPMIDQLSRPAPIPVKLDASYGLIKNKTKKWMQVAINEGGLNPQIFELAPLQAIGGVSIAPEKQTLRVRNFAKTRFGCEDEKVYDGQIKRDAKGSWRLELKEKKFKFKK